MSNQDTPTQSDAAPPSAAESWRVFFDGLFASQNRDILESFAAYADAFLLSRRLLSPRKDRLDVDDVSTLFKGFELALAATKVRAPGPSTYAPRRPSFQPASSVDEAARRLESDLHTGGHAGGALGSGPDGDHGR